MNEKSALIFRTEERIAELRQEISGLMHREGVILSLIGKTETSCAVIETVLREADESMTALASYQENVYSVRKHLERLNWILLDEDASDCLGRMGALAEALHHKYRETLTVRTEKEAALNSLETDLIKIN